MSATLASHADQHECPLWHLADNPVAPAFIRYWTKRTSRTGALKSRWVRATASKRLQTRLVRYRIDNKRLDFILLDLFLGVGAGVARMRLDLRERDQRELTTLIENPRTLLPLAVLLRRSVGNQGEIGG